MGEAQGFTSEVISVQDDQPLQKPGILQNCSDLPPGVTGLISGPDGCAEENTLHEDNKLSQSSQPADGQSKARGSCDFSRGHAMWRDILRRIRYMFLNQKPGQMSTYSRDRRDEERLGSSRQTNRYQAITSLVNGGILVPITGVQNYSVIIGCENFAAQLPHFSRGHSAAIFQVYDDGWVFCNVLETNEMGLAPRVCFSEAAIMTLA
ncbi:hypothetical protein NYO67_2135 [Aspergillus flavus]|nr:hypothetical protein NYO67_2135 [Aspergillus flavus]